MTCVLIEKVALLIQLTENASIIFGWKNTTSKRSSMDISRCAQEKMLQFMRVVNKFRFKFRIFVNRICIVMLFEARKANIEIYASIYLQL